MKVWSTLASPTPYPTCIGLMPPTPLRGPLAKRKFWAKLSAKTARLFL